MVSDILGIPSRQVTLSVEQGCVTPHCDETGRGNSRLFDAGDLSDVYTYYRLHRMGMAPRYIKKVLNCEISTNGDGLVALHIDSRAIYLYVKELIEEWNG